jgi:16S rRNA U516 pseudouridylate synthase RsuA-like enzyme
MVCNEATRLRNTVKCLESNELVLNDGFSSRRSRQFVYFVFNKPPGVMTERANDDGAK